MHILTQLNTYLFANHYMKKHPDVDGYISKFTEEQQALLRLLRTIVTTAAPQAEEVISYGMPAYKLNGMLVWFAAYTNHIGFYPKESGIHTFQKELSIYKTSKGAVQFPIDAPLPVALIKRIVKFRVKENLLKVNAKKI